MQLAAFCAGRALHAADAARPPGLRAATTSSSSLGREAGEPPLAPAPGPGRASSSSSGRARKRSGRLPGECAVWRARMPDGDGTHLTRMLTRFPVPVPVPVTVENSVHRDV